MNDNIVIDSNSKKIIKDNDYLLISGKDINKYELKPDVKLIKNKNLYFIPSIITNVEIRKNLFVSDGYIVYLVKEYIRDINHNVVGTNYNFVLNAISLKKKDQKIVDRFEYDSLDDFFVLFTSENRLEFSKLKLFGLDSRYLDAD